MPLPDQERPEDTLAHISEHTPECFQMLIMVANSGDCPIPTTHGPVTFSDGELTVITVACRLYADRKAQGF